MLSDHVGFDIERQIPLFVGSVLLLRRRYCLLAFGSLSMLIWYVLRIGSAGQSPKNLLLYHVHLLL